MNRLHFVKLSLAGKKGLVAVCIATLSICLILSLVFSGLMQGINELASGIADRDSQAVRILQIKPYEIKSSGEVGTSKYNLPYSDGLITALRTDSKIERMTLDYYVNFYVINKILFNGREIRSFILEEKVIQIDKDNIFEVGEPTNKYHIYSVDPAFDTFVFYEYRLGKVYQITDPTELIVAGRDFQAGDTNSALVSEQQAYFLGYEDYSKIVGQVLSLSYTNKNGQAATRDIKIVGVYSDMLATDRRTWEQSFLPDKYKHLAISSPHDLLLPDNFIFTKDFFDDAPEHYLYTESITGIIPREESININVLVKSVLDVPQTAEYYGSQQFGNHYIDYNFSNDYLIQVINCVQFIGLSVLCIAVILLACVVIYVVNLTILDMRRRKKSIALLKVVGYRQNDILFMNVFEFSIIAIIASAVSVLVAYVLIYFVNDYCVNLFSAYCEVSANAFMFRPVYAIIAIIFTFAALIAATVLATAKFSKMESVRILKD